MFRKLRGKPSKDLMRNGLLGRGLITNIEGTNVATGVGPDPKHVCIFTLEVALDNVPRYHATCRQAVSQVLLPTLASGESFVAVRVNPDDHSEVAIDFDEALPEVRMTRNDPKAGSAAQVLAEGLPCRVVITRSAPMGMKNPAGVDMHGFQLTVTGEGLKPYQMKVGLPVPPEALPLVYPGSKVPAKRMPDREDAVVIDWDAALSEASTTT